MRSAARTRWRFSIASLIIITVTLAGCGFVMLAVTPLYQTTASYLLINPAGTSVSKNQDANPFLRFDDPSVVIATIGIRLDAEAVKDELGRKGAAPGYQVVPRERPAATSPIADIKVKAPTRAATIRTAELVGQAFAAELRAMQVAAGVKASYRITTIPIDQPATATSPGPLKLWLLLAVIGLGGSLLLVVVYGLSVRDRRREPVPSAPARRATASRRHGRTRLKPLPGPPPSLPVTPAAPPPAAPPPAPEPATVEPSKPNGSEDASPGLVISEALRFKHFARLGAKPVGNPVVTTATEPTVEAAAPVDEPPVKEPTTLNGQVPEATRTADRP